MNLGWNIKCIYCGKFISNKDLDDNTKTKSEMRHAWDGEPIENEWWHIKCESTPKVEVEE